MAYYSKIEWTGPTWNPGIGCDKVSPGCKYCYMMRDMGPKLKAREIEVNGNVTRTSDKTFYAPLNWQASGRRMEDGRRLLVFTSSLTDIFHEKIDEYRHEIWDIIKMCPDLIFQILTKRPERIVDHLPEDWGKGYENVWLGVSVEDQKRANERIPILTSIPAKVRFLSIEPLIGKIDLMECSDHISQNLLPGHSAATWTELLIDWAIIGGESGNENGKWRYRPMEMEWVQSLIIQLYNNEIPTFIKQLGTYQYHKFKEMGFNIGRKGGKLKDLPTHYNFLKLREFPKSYQNEKIKG